MGKLSPRGVFVFRVMLDALTDTIDNRIDTYAKQTLSWKIRR